MTPEEILRALAESNPIAHEMMGDTEDYFCVLCESGTPLKTDDHSPVCPWRLAVEYIAAIDNLAP